MPQPLSYYLTLLTDPWRSAPKMNAWLTVNLQLFQDVIVCSEEFDAAFDPTIASGPQLDILGSIVGQSRTVGFQPSGGASPILDDPTYALLIRATILKNHWNGQIDSLIAIWSTIFPSGALKVVDHQNMTVDLYVSGPASSIVQDLATHGYLLPRPQGVLYTYHWAMLPMFGFDLNASGSPVSGYISGFDQGYFV